MDNIVILITTPTEDEAVDIGNALVEERLAACVNILKGIRSIYRWEDTVEDEREVLMVVKTRRSLFGAVESKVKDLHTYSEPEVIALPIVDGASSYLSWIQDNTRQP